jgi:hypothetical protein
MTINMKRVLLRGVIMASFACGAIGTASACVFDNFGYCVPVCHQQWIQTGFFAGQGYWTQICN